MVQLQDLLFQKPDIAMKRQFLLQKQKALVFPVSLNLRRKNRDESEGVVPKAPDTRRIDQVLVEFSAKLENLIE